MVTFSLPFSPTRGSLKRRRLYAGICRLAAALFAGLAVLFAVQAVLSTVETTPVVVAARAIERGSPIGDADVRVIDLPKTALGPSMTGDMSAIIGLIAQIDIAAGDSVLTTMARDVPLAPTGTTVIAVRLASSPDGLLPGDEVSLVSTVGCDGEDCTLAEQALVMAVGGQADTGSGSSLGTLYGDNAQTVSCAMRPKEASKVIALQEAGAVVAVMR
ncbi:SAF domain-containing protein [Bifidobacterium sp. UTBIF-78]|uniref:SAF domain-containing protein n=1 Tax=Bifidobacterium sp. UTBIF-78 TaxID=1465263 RepID=UPI001127BC83|nr:SAF domain-containing protein [Bifidobacterium sp. UTBIF-78]TPF94960.1 flagellar basal body P-ring biosynthesis protein FlgA [Bifidobacterium sp. UTBIF-78]